MANLDMSSRYNHFAIDKAEELHRRSIAQVLQAVSGGGGPAPAKPQQVSTAPAQ
jgi:hypothetical protein